MKKLLVILSLCGLLLCLLVAAAPRIVSSRAARQVILGEVGQRLHGSLDADSWSFSWLRGVELRRLGVSLPEQGLDLQVKRIGTQAGLWDILVRRSAGTIEILQPVMSIALPGPPASSKPPPATSSMPPRRDRLHGRETGQAGPTPPPLLAAMDATVNLRDGTVTAESRNGDRVTVKVDFAVQKTNGLVKVRHLNLVSPFATARASGDNAGCTFALDLDLAAAHEHLDPIVHLGDIQLAGKLAVRGACTFEGTTVTIPELTMDLKQGVIGKSNTAITIPDIHATAHGSADPKQQKAVIDGLEVTSDLVTVSAKGTLTDWTTEQNVDLEGSMEVDWPKLTEILSLLRELGVEIGGGAPRDISVHTSLGAGAWPEVLRSTDASAELYAGSIAWLGIETGHVEPSLTVRDGRAYLDLETGLDDGQLAVHAVMDATEDPPVLRVPAGSQVITNVPLTQAMATDLLARIHPVLRGCTTLGGRVNVRLDEVRLPLDSSFSSASRTVGVLALRDVAVKPEGLLSEIMTLLKEAPQPGRLPDQDIRFELADGRITSSPLEIVSNDVHLTFQGSVGLDGTLDYVAEAPVTPGLVDKKVYRYVKNARLKLLITGNASDPKISRQSFTDSLGSLVREAGKKFVQEQGQQILEKLFQ